MDEPEADALMRRLAEALEPVAVPTDARRAAVAAALRAGADGLEVLLMRRAEREGDRWSGQVSLPGGHAEPVDADLAATAMRETLEEVGLDLARDATCLGEMTPLQARARGRRVHTWITPVVFRYDGAGELTLGPEASDAFWMPLTAARRGDFDEAYRYDHEGVTLKLPGWRHGPHHVWGLTHRIVSSLLDLMD